MRFLRRDATGALDYDRTAFLQSQPAGRRPFLQTLVHTQMFEQVCSAAHCDISSLPLTETAVTPSASV